MAKDRINKIKNSRAVKDIKKVGKAVSGYLGLEDAAPAEPKKPRAKFGSGEGKFNTFLGIAPSQVEEHQTRTEHLQHGISEGSIRPDRHVPIWAENRYAEQPEGVTHISRGLDIAARKGAEKVLKQPIKDSYDGPESS